MAKGLRTIDSTSLSSRGSSSSKPREPHLRLKRVRRQPIEQLLPVETGGRRSNRPRPGFTSALESCPGKGTHVASVKLSGLRSRPKRQVIQILSPHATRASRTRRIAKPIRSRSAATNRPENTHARPRSLLRLLPREHPARSTSRLPLAPLHWFDEAHARKVTPNPNAFTLACLDESGTLTARIVLCKKVLDEGAIRSSTPTTKAARAAA